MIMDCNKTEIYLKELGRMCKRTTDCDGCLIRGLEKDEYESCIIIQARETAKCIAIVQKWSDEHSPKTMLKDFYEKYPNAPISSDGTPMVCAGMIYRGANYICTNANGDCTKCWDCPMPEVE